MMQANAKLDPRLERALSVMTVVKINLDDAAAALVARVDEAANLIKEVDRKLPEEILKSLVTGDRSDLDALYAQRAQAERDLEDYEKVKPLIGQYGKREASLRDMIRDGRHGLPPGEPETWWPEWLTVVAE